MTVARSPIRRDWLVKTLAGALLGLMFAFACSALLAKALAGLPMGIRGQLVMWFVPPVWLGVFSGVYFFRSGLRVWAWLGAANLLVFGLLAAFHGV